MSLHTSHPKNWDLENLPTRSDDSENYKNHWAEVLASDENISFEEFYDEAIAELDYSSQEGDEWKPVSEAPNFTSNWQIGSYSSLAKFHTAVKYEEKVLADNAKDQDDDELTPASSEPIQAEGFFAFPKGATPGTCIHAIFEHIDFQDDTEWRQVIEEKLRYYRLHCRVTDEDRRVLDQRIEDCFKMLKNVCETELLPKDFALKGSSEE